MYLALSIVESRGDLTFVYAQRDEKKRESNWDY